jgi:hypothetical protein
VLRTERQAAAENFAPHVGPGTKILGTQIGICVLGAATGECAFPSGLDAAVQALDSAAIEPWRPQSWAQNPVPHHPPGWATAGALGLREDLSSCFFPLRSRYSIRLQPTRYRAASMAGEQGSTTLRRDRACVLVCAGPQAPACGEHGRRGDACGAGLLDIAFCERLVLAKLLAGDPPDVGLQRGGRLGTSNLQAVEVQAQHLMSGHACTTARTQCHRACTPACMRTGHRAHRPAGTLTVSREDAIVCMFFKKKTLQQFGHSVGV